MNQLSDEMQERIDLLKPSKPRSNLSKSEKQGFKWILKELDHGDVRVVQADKGGALCIVPKSYIQLLEQDKLDDSNRYENLGSVDPTPAAQEKMYELWRDGEDQHHISREESHAVVGLCEKKNNKPQRPSTSTIFKPKTPYFYGLLKIHKLRPEELVPGAKIPIRLVTDLSHSVTARSDKFLNWKFLQPLQEEFCKDLVRDSTAVIQWLEEINRSKTKKNIHGFSWDFAALYDNLTPSLVLEALEQAILELRPEWTESCLTTWILQLVKLSLDSSFAKHGSNWFKSIIGIPTGGALSVTLANIAVYYVMRNIYSAAPHELLGLKRFVDDIGGLWEGTVEQFELWSDEVNAKLKEKGLSIKEKSETSWDINKPGEFTVFLDIKYTFDNINGLKTDVNIKETDARVYLHYSSYHPKQTFPSIVYSQALRYKRIINNTDTLKLRLNELTGCFLNSGYPLKMVKGIMDDVIKRNRNLDYKVKRKEAPFPVAWVQTYSPATSEIQTLVKEANIVLKQSPIWNDDEKVIGLVNRRGKNIGDIVLQRKRFALMPNSESTGTTKCTPDLNPGERRKRGRPCESCKLMSQKNYIKSHHTGKKYHTPSANCQSKNIIYAAQCLICQKQYAGKTTCKLQTRIAGHRSHVNKTTKTILLDTDEAALSEHLKTHHQLATSTTELFNLNYSFTVVQINPSDLDKCEQFWVSRLGTMEPFGLNIEKPRGVADTIITMSKRARSQRK